MLLPLARSAIQSPGAANLSLEVIEEFRAKGVPDDKWALLMETMGNGENTAAVRALVKETSPFPSTKLVALLVSKTLAVRLGALDLLEDAAGETFGFNAWQEDPVAGPNADALARWNTWAEKGKVAVGKSVPLTEETFRVIAEEIVSGNRDRAERAMLRLDGHGLAAIAHIEAFLKSHADMEPASLAALKAAEYRVTLMQSLPKQAAAVARDLALGSTEAQAVALHTLNGAGATALPIIAEFLASPDPLVRETAVDAAFAAGAKHAVPLILARLDEPKSTSLVDAFVETLKKGGAAPKPDAKPARETEKTNSVLHAMLRGLGKYSSDDKHARTIALYTAHPDENVVVSAIEALGSASLGGAQKEIAARLDDPRWRVRAAALETIGKRRDATLKDRVVKCFGDSDLFVRVTAVATIGHIAQKEAPGILAAEFAKSDELKPAIIKAIFDNRMTPTPTMWEQLRKAPPEIILQCLDTLDASRDDHEGKRIPYAAPFARHPNKDVSAQALRLLASRGRHSALLLDALNSGDAAKQDAVLDQLHLPIGSLASAGSGPAQADANSPAAVPNPKLDALYDAFKLIKPAAPAGTAPNAPNAPEVPAPEGDDEEAAAAATGEKSAPPVQLRATLARYFKDGSPRQRFVSAVSLAMEGDADAAKFLLTSIDAMSGLDRRYIASALSVMPKWAAPVQEIATRLLRDEADDVREAMLHGWMENPDRFGALLAEYSRPGSLITPDQVYDYRLDRLMASGNPPARIVTWAQAALESQSAPYAKGDGRRAARAHGAGR